MITYQTLILGSWCKFSQMDRTWAHRGNTFKIILTQMRKFKDTFTITINSFFMLLFAVWTSIILIWKSATNCPGEGFFLYENIVSIISHIKQFNYNLFFIFTPVRRQIQIYSKAALKKIHWHIQLNSVELFKYCIWYQTQLNWYILLKMYSVIIIGKE